MQAVTDGLEALAACAEATPDAVILDASLPEVSGWDVLASLRAGAHSPPVIMLTADPLAGERARQAGATALVRKPFDIDEVLEAAERVLPRRTT